MNAEEDAAGETERGGARGGPREAGRGEFGSAAGLRPDRDRHHQVCQWAPGAQTTHERGRDDERRQSKDRRLPAVATPRDEHPAEPKEPGMDRGTRERPPDRP